MKTRSLVCRFLPVFLLLAFLSPILPTRSAPGAEPAQPHMVKDINTCTVDANILFVNQADNILYFMAYRSMHGRELWRSDGTEAGTQVLKKITADMIYQTSGSAWLNRVLYWMVDQDRGGLALWRTDGTEAGTALVTEIWVDQGTTMNSNLVVMDGRMYFLVRGINVDNRGELWQSDGSAGGTNRIASVTFTSTVPTLTAFNHHLYFEAVDAAQGAELWQSDGTEGGTALFADLNPQGDSSPNSLLAVGDRLYLVAQNESGRQLLWVTDGTSAGTRPVLAPYDTPQPPLVDLNGTVYFFSFANGSTNSLYLWRTDGTAAGTWQVSDAVFSPSLKQTQSIGIFHGRLVFGTNNDELWQSDGTAAGTWRIKDLGLRSGSTGPEDFHDVAGTLYFSADAILWRSDGSEAGTTWVENGTAPGSETHFNQTLIGVGSNQLFLAGLAACAGEELMRVVEPPTGGTPRAELVKDIETKTGPSYVHSLAAYQGRVFFPAYNGQKLFQLWSSDGTAAGTGLVKAIGTSTGGGVDPDFPTAVANGLLFFTAVDDQGYELWRTDGTPAGTHIVKDINPEYPGPSPRGLIAYRNRSYFFILVSNMETFWKSDGTEPGTQQVASFSPLMYHMSSPVELNGLLYFLVGDSYSTMKLYQSDGTALGTKPVREWKMNGVFIRTPLVSAGGRLYFYAWDAEHGMELWQSDGTPNGTRLTADLTLGVASSTIDMLQTAGNFVYFIRTEDVGPKERAWTLWRAPGAVSPMESLLLSQSFADLTSFDKMATSGTYAYFTLATSNPSRVTFWRSDGTRQGTHELRPAVDIPGSVGDFAPIGGQVFFTRYADGSGNELWTSDGTPEGTHMAFDLRPGPESSDLANLTFINNTLWFSADDGIHGAELWMYDFLTEHTFLPAISR